MKFSFRAFVAPLLIAFAVLVWATGALDRAGFEGAGRGLLVGAAVCAPIWLFNLWRSRRSRNPDAD